jgi:hypothetical protein
LDNQVFHDQLDHNLAGWAHPNGFQKGVEFSVASNCTIQLNSVDTILNKDAFPLEKVGLLKGNDVIVNVVLILGESIDHLRLELGPGPLDDGSLP